MFSYNSPSTTSYLKVQLVIFSVECGNEMISNCEMGDNGLGSEYKSYRRKSL